MIAEEAVLSWISLSITNPFFITQYGRRFKGSIGAERRWQHLISVQYAMALAKEAEVLFRLMWIEIVMYVTASGSSGSHDLATHGISNMITQAAHLIYLSS